MSTEEPLVQVLLSLYEPGEYLVPQLQSVRAQDHPAVYTLVRDDGSSSATLGRVEAELHHVGPHRFVAGPHLGAARSFLSMLGELEPEAQYAAFCDQDDIWMRGKLSRAVHALSGVQGPAMYCSAVRVTTQDLRPLRLHATCTRGPSFANALVQNIATGCTVVLNRPGAELAGSYVPAAAVMHDAWCYLLISGAGSVVYDPQPQVLYRVHPGNAVGVAPGRATAWASRVQRRLLPRQLAWTAQAAELSDKFRDALQPGAQRYLDEFLAAAPTFSRRLRYAASRGAYFQSRSDSLAFKLSFVLRGA